MRILLTITLFSLLISCKSKESINKRDIIKSKNSTFTKSYSFPDDWMGYWEGELKIYSQNQLKQTISMALDHAPTDSVGQYSWAIIYGEGEDARRDYKLITINDTIGHFAVDENNGLILDSYLFENKMVSQFEVMGNRLQSIYTLNGDEMIFEIFSGSSSPVRETITSDSDSIKVSSYSTKVMQRAILKKRSSTNSK